MQRTSAIVVGLISLATTASALAKNRIPINVGACLCGVRAHPAQVGFGVDGAVDLAGYVTGPRAYGSPRGHLHWTTWGDTAGRGWGGFWVDNNTPSVASGTMTIYKVSVRVFRPRAGIFTRMTVTSQSGHRLGPYGKKFTLHAVDQGGWIWER